MVEDISGCLKKKRGKTTGFPKVETFSDVTSICKVQLKFKMLVQFSGWEPWRVNKSTFKQLTNCL